MKIEEIRDNIMYIEVRRGKYIAHTNDGDIRIKYRGKLKDFLDYLPERYKMVSFDCIVDDDLVTEYDFTSNTFTLKNGQKLELLAKTYNLEKYY